VRILAVDGGGDARDITTDRVRFGGAQVSPDCRRIAYTSFDDQKRSATTVCDLPTCASPRTFPVGAIRWTSDSKGLAYLPTPVDVWIQPLDGGAARQLTHFAADGQQIWGLAFASDADLRWAAPPSRTTSSCFAG
jgi:Tol biopolymer transport system component